MTESELPLLKEMAQWKINRYMVIGIDYGGSQAVVTARLTGLEHCVPPAGIIKPDSIHELRAALSKAKKSEVIWLVRGNGQDLAKAATPDPAQKGEGT